LQAEAEERECGDDSDIEGETQGGLHDERAGDVGEDFAEEDSPPRLSERLGGPNEVPLDDLDGRASGHAGDARCGRDSHGEDKQPNLRPDRSDSDQGQHELWEGEDDVHATHK
jgi:hypothetical protein